MKIIISPQAEADLSDIWHYIAEDNLEAADRVIAKIKQIIANLSNSPKMGHCRDNFSRGLRSVPVGRYLIFYREIKERLEVVHVLHGARDITSDLF
jgi:toxin ParE1/3/4